MDISVCIPTYKRQALLRIAIDSVARQTVLPREIIVSDDERSHETREICSEYRKSGLAGIRYAISGNLPGLANNINNCFKEASGDLICLLHDDDVLEPECLQSLAKPFLDDRNVVASYGKQYVIDFGGDVLNNLTELTNRIYHRNPNNAGLQPDSLLAGLVQQFPNDGYLVRSDVARKVGHNPAFGNASEVDFGIRCSEYGKYFFVNNFTASYRITGQSLAGNRSANCSYNKVRLLLRAQEAYPSYRDVIDQRIADGLPTAIIQAARCGYTRDAIKWYFDRRHLQKIPTLGGMRRLMAIVCGK